MTRKEVFIRGLAMVNRIEELKAKYGWKEEDITILLDDDDNYLSPTQENIVSCSLWRLCE